MKVLNFDVFLLQKFPSLNNSNYKFLDTLEEAVSREIYHFQEKFGTMPNISRVQVKQIGGITLATAADPSSCLTCPLS